MYGLHSTASSQTKQLFNVVFPVIRSAYMLIAKRDKWQFVVKT